MHKNLIECQETLVVLIMFQLKAAVAIYLSVWTDARYSAIFRCDVKHSCWNATMELIYETTE